MNVIDTKKAFHSPGLYRQLSAVLTNWQRVREEAREVLEEMSYITDSRAREQAWRVLPIMPEEEDLSHVPQALIHRARKLAPLTVELLAGIAGIRGFAFSALAAHASIKAHKHDNPYVTAMLCLQCQGEAYIINGGQRKDFVEGEIIVFDYTMIHEVVNNSDTERIVLLILLDNALMK